MGLWSAYFFAKLLLYGGGYIDFKPWLNLAFAAFTMLPAQNSRLRFAKNLIAVPLGIMLLYHDSWLPPFSRVLSQADLLAGFTLPYLVDLLGRFLSIKVLAELTAMLALYTLLRRKLRMSTFAFLGIIGVGLWPGRLMFMAPAPGGASAPFVAATAAGPTIDPRNMRPEALDSLLAAFYQKENSRQVRFPRLRDGDTPYDIIVLHVCSLSWDDLRAVKMIDDPLFRSFDVLLREFNSAASYSGPAAIRVLRGSCGQIPHKQLYDAVQPGCLLIDGLQQAGFEPHWLMNHDGHYGNFYADVRERGGMPVTPDSNAGAYATQHAFDGTPVYDDYSVLSRWWEKRQRLGARHVVLYYNTISLHDGNRLDGRASLSTEANYQARLTAFLGDVRKFLDDLRRSGRHVIVVFVPEHGAAVRGDRRQITGLREIPTPGITQVPAGIVLVNNEKPGPDLPQTVETRSSYLGLTELLSRFVTDNPFEASQSTLATYTVNLPQTDVVSENEGAVVMQVGSQYMMRTPDGAWSPWVTQ